MDLHSDDRYLGAGVHVLAGRMRMAHEVDLDICCPIGPDLDSNPCMVQATVEEGPDVPGGWRILTYPIRCEMNGIYYDAPHRRKLDDRIEKEYDRYVQRRVDHLHR